MRGDIITVAMPGDYGKPRPALVVQSDKILIPSTTVLLLTSNITHAPTVRLTVEPTLANGLRRSSQIMIDKTMTVRNEKVGPTIGQLDTETLARVDRAIAIFFGLG